MATTQKNNNGIKLTKKFAKICWVIDEDGKIGEAFANPDGTNVFAIIDRQRNKIVVEIGLAGSRPYNRHYSRGLGVEIPKRKKEDSLTQRQYKNIGPKIWQQLQEITIANMSDRKSGGVFYKKVCANKNFKCKQKVKFIFDKRDGFLINDIFFAELFLNNNFQQRIAKIKSTITKKTKRNSKNLQEIISPILFPDYVQKHGYKPTPYYVIKYFMAKDKSLAYVYQYFLFLLRDKNIDLERINQKIKMAEIALKQIDKETQLRIYNEDSKNIFIEVFMSPL